LVWEGNALLVTARNHAWDRLDPGSAEIEWGDRTDVGPGAHVRSRVAAPEPLALGSGHPWARRTKSAGRLAAGENRPRPPILEGSRSGSVGRSWCHSTSEGYRRGTSGSTRSGARSRGGVAVGDPLGAPREFSIDATLHPPCHQANGWTSGLKRDLHELTGSPARLGT
jgi:hypothetical protein